MLSHQKHLYKIPSTWIYWTLESASLCIHVTYRSKTPIATLKTVHIQITFWELEICPNVMYQETLPLPVMWMLFVCYFWWLLRYDFFESFNKQHFLIWNLLGNWLHWTIYTTIAFDKSNDFMFLVFWFCQTFLAVGMITFWLEIYGFPIQFDPHSNVLSHHFMLLNLTKYPSNSHSIHDQECFF